MSVYYGVQRSQEYLAHYGVKGMKWGVQRALKKGDQEKIKQHYAKARKKLDKLRNQTSIIDAAEGRKLHKGMAKLFGGFTGVEGGLAGALIAKEGVKALPVAGFGVGVPGAMALTAGINYKRNANKLTTKGHNKRLEKVRKWENGMADAFKGTNFEKDINDPDFKKNSSDEYRLVDVKRNNKTGLYEEKEVAKIKGSHLTSDYHGKDKDNFIRLAGQGINPQDKSGHVQMRSLQASHEMNLNSHDPMKFAYHMKDIQKQKTPFEYQSTESYHRYLSEKKNKKRG